MRGKVTLGLCVAFAGLGAAGWFGRDAVKARYYVHKLMAAADDEWVGRAGSWGEGVADRLVQCLADDNERNCERAGAAIVALSAGWSADDPRHTALIGRLAERFASFSADGQQWALDFAADRVRSGHPAVLAAARQLVASGLQSPEASVRVRAVRLATRPELSHLEPLLPLLRDAVPEVRRATVLAIGPSRSLVADDELLPCLHDSDTDVQRLAKTALLSRGLTEKQVLMGKLLSDSRPAERLKLLALLGDEGELDLNAWLRRLSQDPSPAVRAATARVAGEQQVFQMADRLAQMASADPDSTVRPIAHFHLQMIQTVRPAGVR